LFRQTFQYLKARDFQPYKQSLLIAVSGGVDSVALLHFWLTAGREYFSCRIAVAHVDHAIRKGSMKDREFVEKLCRKWKIPCFSLRLKPSQRPKEMSLEMWGRQQRYTFFSRLCVEKKYQWILTAHHLDDQLETLLLRLGRGTGIRGLQGIHFFRRPNIIRPFLNRTKDELMVYARQHNLKWRTDPTNKKPQYERNWYRLQVVPVWKKREPSLLPSVLHISDMAHELCPKLETWLGRSVKKSVDHGYCLPVDYIEQNFKNDPGSLFLALYILAEKSGIGFHESNFNEFKKQWKNNPFSVRISIDVNWELRSSRKNLWFSPIQLQTDKNIPQAIEMDISDKISRFEGTWNGKQIHITAKQYPKPAEFRIIKKKGQKAFLDAEGFSSTLLIRTRKEGDRFSPLGTVSYKKKLKSYFNGIKYPVELRGQQMLVCNKETVVWIPNLEVSEFYKVRKSSRQILELEIKCQN
jgi:tRNA(Ile)-lysidine synthase